MTNPTEPILCYVTDRRALSGHVGSAVLAAKIRAAAEAGVDWIQIREKDLSGRELLDFAGESVASIRTSKNLKTRIIINDRLDVAVAAGADGIHLGEESIPVGAVCDWRDRSQFRERFLVGASCHSLESAIAAENERADYIFFGPVFATPSKSPFGSPQGLGELSAICRRVRLTVLAIGGVTSENVQQCLEAGAAGIAAIRLFQKTSDVRALVERIRKRC